MKKTVTIPETLFRTATFDRSAIDEEKRTVELSISSDAPYMRYFGNEILDHSAKCIDMTRMNAGAPLLFNHNRDAHIGRIIEAKTDGKCLRVKAQFSNSPLGQEKFQDVKDGILRETSVGYQVDRMILEKEDSQNGDTYRVTSWTPFEGSLVTIPADPSVGVGRDHESAGVKEILIERENDVDVEEKLIHTRSMPDAPVITPTAPVIDVNAERETAIKDFKTRCKKIDEYVESLKNPQWKEAARLVASKHKDGEANFDEFRTEALNGFEGVKAVAAGEKPDIGMTEKDVKRFSLVGAVRQIIGRGRLEGFEKEVCDAAQKQMRRDLPNASTFVLPEEVTRHQREMSLREFMTRAGNATTATAGGFLVQNEYGSLIELLRNKTVLGQLGITIIDGVVGDLIMPVQTGGCTAYWVSETGSITDSQATFAQKSMTPKRLGASYPFTMQLLNQSSTSIDSFVRNELDTVLALKKDLAGLLGSGVAGEPLGVANTPGINATVTYGGAATWADVVEHETGITVDNADIGSMGFALSAATVGKWKTILKDSVAGAGYLIENMTANGYPVKRTNQISSANQSFFGVWSQLLLAMWAGREVTVDSITLAKSGQHQIIINELCDFLVRQPLAFNVSTDSAAA
jgi:HK97 family phage major capsid protein/HK97 family phage prohead protease